MSTMSAVSAGGMPADPSAEPAPEPPRKRIKQTGMGMRFLLQRLVQTPTLTGDELKTLERSLDNNPNDADLSTFIQVWCQTGWAAHSDLETVPSEDIATACRITLKVCKLHPIDAFEAFGKALIPSLLCELADRAVSFEAGHTSDMTSVVNALVEPLQWFADCSSRWFTSANASLLLRAMDATTVWSTAEALLDICLAICCTSFSPKQFFVEAGNGQVLFCALTELVTHAFEGFAGQSEEMPPHVVVKMLQFFRRLFTNHEVKVFLSANINESNNVISALDHALNDRSNNDTIVQSVWCISLLVKGAPETLCLSIIEADACQILPRILNIISEVHENQDDIIREIQRRCAHCVWYMAVGLQKRLFDVCKDRKKYLVTSLLSGLNNLQQFAPHDELCKETVLRCEDTTPLAAALSSVLAALTPKACASVVLRFRGVFVRVASELILCNVILNDADLSSMYEPGQIQQLMWSELELIKCMRKRIFSDGLVPGCWQADLVLFVYFQTGCIPSDHNTFCGAMDTARDSGALLQPRGSLMNHKEQFDCELRVCPAATVVNLISKDIDAIQSGDCELCDLFFPNLFWCEHPAPEVCDALLNAEALHIYVAHILTDSALDYERRFIAESVHNAKNFPSMTAVLELIELAKQGI